MLAALEKAQGAHSAGEAFWLETQRDAAAEFAGKLATALEEQLEALAQIRVAYQAAGAATFTVDAEAISAVLDLIDTEGICAVFPDVADELRQRGDHERLIASLEELSRSDDLPSGDGEFPSSWIAAVEAVLPETIASLREFAGEVGNLPPTAEAGSDVGVECINPNGSHVTLDGSGSSDPDGDTLSFEWTDSTGTVVGSTAVVNVDVALGTSVFSLSVTAENGATDRDTVAVMVADTVDPSLTLSLSPAILWPPSHQLVSVTPTVDVADACDANPAIQLLSISSSEPDDGLGDGDTANDIQGADPGTDDREFGLRAERSGRRDGRVYTVTYQATDASGNKAQTQATTTVPHSRGGRN